ncbi:MAG: DUF4136 domain-containing protein [Variovorax sp.]
MKRLLFALLVATSLAGCATRWVVDSDVKSFSGIAAVPAGASYRFERLPSQQVSEPQQQQLEAMAGAALERVGLRRDDANPRYSAQIGARVTAELSPWADPWLYGGGWGGWGGWGYGGGWYGSAFPPASNPWYDREVSIVLRELQSNRVVYETSARNEGPYSASGAILPVMFQAALHGFPNPPAIERRVDIELPVANR